MDCRRHRRRRQRALHAHRRNVPRGYEHILDDEPDYGGFPRGRVARSVDGFQLVVVYCRPEALAAPGRQLDQLLTGLRRLPVPLDQDALVISDNGDLYGTVDDLAARQQPPSASPADEVRDSGPTAVA